MASSKEYCCAQIRIKRVDDVVREISKCIRIVDEDLEENSNLKIFLTPPQSLRETWSRYDEFD